MRIEKEQLHDILIKLKPVSLKDDLLVENFLGQLIFSKEGITIFNDQTYIFYPIETDLNCIISYTRLINFITKTKGKYIKIIHSEDKAKISCGKAKLSLNSLFLDEIDAQIIDEIKKISDGKITAKIPKGFCEGIESCSYSASNDPAAGTLTCICIREEFIVGFDSTRVGVYEMETPISKTDKTILINASLTSILANFEPVKFKLSDSWSVFKNSEDIIFAMRSIRGSYPIDKVLPLFDKFKANKRIKLPDEINRIIDLIISMTNETTYIDRYVDINIEEDSLILSSSSESAAIEEKIKIDYTGSPFSFTINPIALQQALNIVGTSMLKRGKDNSMVLMQSGNFKHIIALKRQV